MKYSQLLFAAGMQMGLTLISAYSAAAADLAARSFSPGGVSTQGTVTLNSSQAALGGTNTAGTSALRSGYPGQLFDFESFAVEVPGSGAAEVADNATLQLAATVTNTDATTYDAASQAAWSSLDAAVSSVDAGLVTPVGVVGDVSVTITADYLGESDDFIVTILDIDTDNFVTAPYNFAGDGIPDSWQLANFRPGSGSASPEASPALDGRVNFFKYYFVLSPLRYDLTDVVTATTVDVGGNDHLAIRFTRAADIPASITPQVRFGDNVAATENARNGILVESIDNGNGTVTETYRDVSPISGAAFGVVEVSFN